MVRATADPDRFFIGSEPEADEGEPVRRDLGLEAPVLGPPAPTDEQLLEAIAHRNALHWENCEERLEPVVEAMVKVGRRMLCPCGECLSPAAAHTVTCDACEGWCEGSCLVMRCLSCSFTVGVHEGCAPPAVLNVYGALCKKHGITEAG